MKVKKTTLLIIVLCFPALIFIFLKFFGQNVFDVPLLHEEAVTAPAGCGYHYEAPYRVADSVMQRMGKSAPFSLVVFAGREPVENRVYNEFSKEAVRMVGAAELSENPSLLKQCILLAPPETDLVLVDTGKRIRGYYSVGDQDELDRLIVELKILLEKY